MWSVVDEATDTRATEVPGVGVVIANACGMCFVPNTRIFKGRLQREDRTTPPLANSGKTAAEIRAAQPLVVDPGALSYLVSDIDAAEY